MSNHGPIPKASKSRVRAGILDTPGPAGEVGEPPARLTGEARQIWRDIVASLNGTNLLCQADRIALESLSDLVARLRAIRASTPLSSVDKNVLVRLASLEKLASGALDSLGLTPVARQRLHLSNAMIRKRRDAKDKFFKDVE